MRKLRFAWLLALMPALFVLWSCGGAANQDQKTDTLQSQVQVNETEALVQYLEKSGDFINSPDVPAMIKATEVFENIGNPRFLVLDIRKHDDYLAGHINGALHVAQSDILEYLTKDCQPGNYDKIALVCYSGQQASYVTGVLRMMGYANVYAMKWGMSSWAPKFAEEKWAKSVSSHLVGKLDTTETPKAPKGTLPTVATGKTDPMEILEARAAEVLKLPFKDISRKLDDLMADPSKYYVINYWPADKYKAGHLPTATQYTPKKSFALAADLATVPANKPVLVYCFTGQHSAFAVAYLRLLGYDAYSLVYGSNSFMQSQLAQGGEAWSPFLKTDVHNYPVVAGEQATDGKVEAPKAPVKAASPEKKAEGGC